MNGPMCAAGSGPARLPLPLTMMRHRPLIGRFAEAEGSMLGLSLRDEGTKGRVKDNITSFAEFAGQLAETLLFGKSLH